MKSVSELGALYRSKALSPVEVVQECLARIAELNPTLNAFITVLADEALEAAGAAEASIRAGKSRGALHGIPVGIKDFYDTAGVKTTAAFEHFANRVPARDAVGVARLKAAGAIIVGKTNMHRLGIGTTGLDSAFGPVRNPLNAKFMPGGSSSGSAVAVAAGMCCATLDTDAIGSCRLPAACCGVVGFKGTYGLISVEGILQGEAPPDETIVWLSHAGITARTVADAALVLDVLAERSKRAPRPGYAAALARAGTPQIGVVENFKADRAVRAAFEKAVEAVRALGHPMKSAAAPAADLRSGVGNIEADRRSVFKQSFNDIDVLLLPTTTTRVPRVADAGANPQAVSPENTLFANYYGLPAISVPCGLDAGGLPFGLQIVGPPWADGSMLQLAHQYQTMSQQQGARSA